MPEKNNETTKLWAQYEQSRKAKIAPRIVLAVAVVVGLVLVFIGLWIVIK